MTIVRPKSITPQTEKFIAGAPDSMAMLSNGVRLKTKRGRARSQVSVVMPDALLVELDAAVAKRFTTRSALITQLVRDFLRGHD